MMQAIAFVHDMAHHTKATRLGLPQSQDYLVVPTNVAAATGEAG